MTTLIVTVDTEEEGLWSGQFPTTACPVSNISRLPDFQQLCSEFGVRPTYLVNTPVVEDDDACSILKPYQDNGLCEIGTHIHPWNTSPGGATYTPHSSYLCNLPYEVQKEKLATVTEQIESRLGVRPVSFRAGRYGMGVEAATIIRELGYIVDSSVCPYTDYSGDGGPDFRGAPYEPYWIGDELLDARDQGDLLEVPVSFGFSHRRFEALFAIDEFLHASPLRKMKVVGILDRLNLVRKIKFSPEKGAANRLNQLAAVYAALGAPAIVMMFHSSSLLPGATPYVKTEADRERFLATMRGVFDFCLNRLQMPTATLKDFALEFRAPGRPDA